MSLNAFSTKPSPRETSAKEWLPYHENGELKYVRMEEAESFGPTGKKSHPVPQSGYGNMPSGPFTPNVANHVSKKYTDETVIPAVVTNLAVDEKAEAQHPRRSSFLGKLKGSSGKDKVRSKVVWMPRGEYLKHFARDNDGNYSGTEPQRDWTEEELDDAYGHLQEEHTNKVTSKATWKNIFTNPTIAA